MKTYTFLNLWDKYIIKFYVGFIQLPSSDS